MKGRKIKIFAGVWALLTVLLLVLVLVGVPHERALYEVRTSTQDFVYAHLQQASQALDEYAETQDAQALQEAREALLKTVSACYAYGDAYDYRASYDTASDVIQEWDCLFFIQTAQYLEDILTDGPQEDDTATLAALTEIFQSAEDQNGQITFMSVFWNFSQSELQDQAAWELLVSYDTDGVLQRADF